MTEFGGTAAASTSKSIRRTQRAPASCTTCTKRKAKCSRTIPCTQCIARGKALQCQREVVLVRGVRLRDDSELGKSDITIESLVEENRRLRAEIALLREDQPETHENTRVGLSASPATTRYEQSEPSDTHRLAAQIMSRSTPGGSRQPAENDLERMATLTNLLEMGRSDGAKSTLDLSESIYGAPNVTAQIPSPLETWLLPRVPVPWQPDSIVAMEMIRFCSENLGWLYLSSFGPAVLERSRSYLIQAAQDGWACYGLSWYALYLSLLVLAIHFAPPSTRQRWDLESNPAATAKMWFDSSIQILMASDFMSHPNTDSCHCICNLACVFHVYGPPVLGNVLLSAAVRIAQNLRIDQLSDDDWCEMDRCDGTQCSRHELPSAHVVVGPDWVEREARRRLWISFPAGYRFVIAPELLTLQVPLNINDSQLGNGQAVQVSVPTTLTDASFHVARSKLSKIMHAFFGAYRQLSRGDPARHRLAWQTDAKLGQLLQDTPFSPGSDISLEDSKLWYGAACHLFRSLIAHKRLLLFREFFALAFTDSRWREARQQCVSRAAEIVTIRRSFTQPLLGSSETASHYLAAALVLALDFVYFGVGSFTTADAVSRQSQLEELVSALKTTETLEGNAGRMLNQVQMLQNLAVEMRADINKPITVHDEAGPAFPATDGPDVPPSEPFGLSPLALPDDTTDWLDGLLQDLGSTEDPSLDSSFLPFTNLEPQLDMA